MAKVFNQAVQLGGETRQIGTPVVTALEFDSNKDVTRAKGASVPTDGDRGYALGCMFVQTDGGTETVLYVNEGSATSADFNPVLSGVAKTETVAATNVITAAESGKVFFLSHATEFASTLPAPAAGLNYKFFVADAPESADYTIVTAGAPDQILAGQVFCNAGTDEDSEAAATATTITFVGGTSVIGDSVDVWSDGTSWFARGFCNATGGITITG